MENSFAKTGKFRWMFAKNVLEVCKETVLIFHFFQVKQSFRESFMDFMHLPFVLFEWQIVT